MIELRVKGMACGHCEKAVAQALAGVPGVTQVVLVSREKNLAVVQGQAKLEALIAAVREEGYEAEAVR